MGNKGRKERKQQRQESLEKGGGGGAEEGDEEGGGDDIYNSADNAVGALALASRESLQCLSKGSQRVLVYCCANSMIAADLSTGELVEAEQPHTETIRCLAFNESKGLVATAGDDKRVVLRDFPSMKVSSIGSTERKAVALCLDSSADTVIFAEKSGEVLSRELSDMSAPSKHVLGHISSLTDMAMTPDGRFLLTSDRDEKVRISHFPATFAIEGFCLGHSELVTCLCLVPLTDGSQGLLTGSADGSVRVWGVPSGELLDTLQVAEEEGGGGEEGGDVGDGGDGGVAEGGASAMNGDKGAAASDSEKPATKKWDENGAGKAKKTAMVSARMRSLSKMPSVVQVATCAAKGIIAIAVERRACVVLAMLDKGNKLRRLSEVPMDSPPVGLCFVAGAGDEELLVAATPSSANALSVVSLKGKGDTVVAARVALEEKHTDPLVRGVWGVSEAAGRVEKGPAPQVDGEASGLVKKKRRHADPEWPGNKK